MLRTVSDLERRKVVTRYRFGSLDKIMIGSVDYSFVATDGNGHVFRRMDGSNIAEGFTDAQVDELLSDERKPMVVQRNFFAPSDAAARNGGSGLVSQLPEVQQIKVLVKQEFCRRWIKLEAEDPTLRRSDKSMAAGLMRIRNDIIADRELGFDRKKRWTVSSPSIALPSPRNFRRWLKLYENAGYNPVALKDKYGKVRRRDHFTPEEWELQQQFALQYASRTQPSMVAVYNRLREQIATRNEERVKHGQPQLRAPTLKTFQNRINSLPAFYVCAGREGEKAARAKFAIVTQGVEAVYPLERVEADEWRVNLQALLAQARIWSTLSTEEKAAVERSRLWLSAVMDVASKCILGFRLTAKEPSSESSIVALEMAVTDKSRIAAAAGCETPWDMKGTPETVVTDSGAAYASNAFQVTVNDLSSAPLLPPSGEAYLRGNIERFFQTLDSMGMAFFSGRTFGSIAKKGDYDAEANASLCMDTLNKVLVRLIVDVYHNTPHSGLGGETPRNAWLRLSGKYGVAPEPTGFLRRNIFGTNVERTITAEGVRLLGIFYQSPELQQLRRKVHNRSVLIRVDRFDLSRISVWQGGNWLDVPARWTGLEGVSVWKWMAAAEKLRSIHNANAKLSERTVLSAVRWLGDQAEIAQAEAELASPVLTDEHFRRVEKRLTRHLDINLEEVGDEVDFDALGTWMPSDEFTELAGTGSSLASNAHSGTKETTSLEAKNPVEDTGDDLPDIDEGFGDVANLKFNN
ncbi:Mu transposase C-terminal domain-containing protein [Mesorhizobium sp. NPDC059054]|uniref:Mu transposase C-terminal domain-containing protein n=1 Tax=Mesorhizobium sp. NPDC059054 TaxID=3346711 RepID=UPI0036A0AD08